uniref:Very-long-chain enoyl-CoA reductase art-1 n=2 Tax=Hirondellea gigas TaxID=1518452 RepID=A0A2P2I6F1_9CRUS
MSQQLEVLNAKTGKLVASITGLSGSSTILQVKEAVHKQKKHLYPDRQAIKDQQKAKNCKDEATLASLNIKPEGGTVYVKDLGPQIGWSTVFLAEYAGPLAIYLWMYTRPWLFYGDDAALKPYFLCTHIAAGCYAAHYIKRLVETKFVHRFSHGTMPISSLFKNCSYYWGFTAYVAYHVNHPLFTAPCNVQIYCGLAAFTFCELGNLSIHWALRQLRPPGSKVRKIPFSTSNPFTWLFKLVSCPNYTYETGAWLSFAVMTQCIPAGLFMLAGFYQMAVWAKGKHRNYRQEFKDYPRGRVAILPYLL